MPQQTEQTTIQGLKTFTDSFNSDLIKVKINRKVKFVWSEKSYIQKT